MNKKVINNIILSPNGDYGKIVTNVQGYSHITWVDQHSPGQTEISYLKMNTTGSVITPPVRLTMDPAFSDVPSIAVDDERVHVVWHDNRDGNSTQSNFEIYYKGMGNKQLTTPCKKFGIC